jgi:hypothetical protein
METWAVVLVCVTSGLNILAAIFSAFFKGYAEKKGENLATKEDFRSLQKQLRENTELIETIKAERLDKSKARERSEETKRLMAMQILDLFGTMKQVALAYFNGIEAIERLQNTESPPEPMRLDANKRYHEGQERFQEMLGEVWKFEQKMRVDFSETVHERLVALREKLKNLRGKVYADRRNFDSLYEDMVQAQDEASKAIRAEVQI